MELASVIVMGIAAGLAIAMPLGAIGVLLIQEGADRGWVGALPAAGGVATTDALLSAVAVVAGAVVAPFLAGAAPWPSVLGGLVLVVWGGIGLVRAGRSDGSRPRGSARGASRFALFVGLTAINPATLVPLAAVVTGSYAVTASPATAVVFVLAVGAASLAWQVMLVSVGALVRTRGSASLRRWTPLVGNAIVIAFGLVLIAASFAG